MGRKLYDDSFKDQVCKLLTDQKQPKSEVCKKLGVSFGAIDSWLRERQPAIKPAQPMPDSPGALKARVLELEKKIAGAEQENRPPTLFTLRNSKAGFT